LPLVIPTRRKFLAMSAGIIASSFIGTCHSQEPNRTFKVTMTTLFWIGERANRDNKFTPNVESYWDKNWEANYGGFDNPHRRNGYWPAEFRPKENPFYAALPYGEFAKGSELKPEAYLIPWFKPDLSPLLKNHWVEIMREGTSCYAQWEDVGPIREDDFDFVFGGATQPKNRFDEKSGLDVSPAVWHYLGMKESGLTSWRFVDAAAVPTGPWTEIVTMSGNNLDMT
jgi:hypothetical protein